MALPKGVKELLPDYLDVPYGEGVTLRVGASDAGTVALMLKSFGSDKTKPEDADMVRMFSLAAKAITHVNGAPASKVTADDMARMFSHAGMTRGTEGLMEIMKFLGVTSETGEEETAQDPLSSESS